MNKSLRAVKIFAFVMLFATSCSPSLVTIPDAGETTPPDVRLVVDGEELTEEFMVGGGGRTTIYRDVPLARRFGLTGTAEDFQSGISYVSVNVDLHFSCGAAPEPENFQGGQDNATRVSSPIGPGVEVPRSRFTAFGFTLADLQDRCPLDYPVSVVTGSFKVFARNFFDLETTEEYLVEIHPSLSP